jgi:hypothetical protein
MKIFQKKPQKRQNITPSTPITMTATTECLLCGRQWTQLYGIDAFNLHSSLEDIFTPILSMEKLRF